MVEVKGLFLNWKGEDVPEVGDEGPVWAVVIQIDGVTTIGANM